MINAELIRSIIDKKIVADGFFIVDITISSDNDIKVVIDHKDGVAISYCEELSRLIEDKLNREIEDYSLEVSSAGIGCELKVLGQFEKNINREVEVTNLDGSHFNGILKEADSDQFIVETSELVKVEGQKKKQRVTKTVSLSYSQVKQVKDIISFK
ncbi:MAG: ribosome assembly cofactor RimP [Marinilabiliaceae bacterium]|nr:ribosome assembly cofactor RimP [Marinilabiliaceae bacterium]